MGRGISIRVPVDGAVCFQLVLEFYSCFFFIDFVDHPAFFMKNNLIKRVFDCLRQAFAADSKVSLVYGLLSLRIVVKNKISCFFMRLEVGQESNA